ncbi:MAG: type II toxin-antitoxin system RelE/ParE family toxin [Chthoniobacter sp.]
MKKKEAGREITITSDGKPKVRLVPIGAAPRRQPFMGTREHLKTMPKWRGGPTVRSARKDLERIDAQTVQRIFPKIAKLAKQPRPSGCLKLQGPDGLWRMRIDDYRVIYLIDDSSPAVHSTAIRHRREAYQ